MLDPATLLVRLFALVPLVLPIFALVSAPSNAQSRQPVAIELALAVDTSLSVDDTEYRLQMSGIARAFRQRQIIELITGHDGVAVMLFQWSTRIHRDYAIDWHLLDTEDSVLEFAAKIDALRRDPFEGFTAMGKAIDHATQQIIANHFDGRRQKIDISGDGRSNSGLLPKVAKRSAIANRIVINGLPILIDTYNLDTYFAEQIIEGPGSFIEPATDYRDFARAFLRKLTRELSPEISQVFPSQPDRKGDAHERVLAHGLKPAARR